MMQKKIPTLVHTALNINNHNYNVVTQKEYYKPYILTMLQQLFHQTLSDFSDRLHKVLWRLYF